MADTAQSKPAPDHGIMPARPTLKSVPVFALVVGTALMFAAVKFSKDLE